MALLTLLKTKPEMSACRKLRVGFVQTLHMRQDVSMLSSAHAASTALPRGKQMFYLASQVNWAQPSYWEDRFQAHSH